MVTCINRFNLVCPSAPLGEVEHVRLGLVLGDLLGLVLEEGFLDGVVSSAGAELKLVSCRKSDMAAGPVLVNIHTALLLHRLANSTFSSERVTMNKA